MRLPRYSARTSAATGRLSVAAAAAPYFAAAGALGAVSETLGEYEQRRQEAATQEALVSTAEQIERFAAENPDASAEDFEAFGKTLQESVAAGLEGEPFAKRVGQTVDSMLNKQLLNFVQQDTLRARDARRDSQHSRATRTQQQTGDPDMAMTMYQPQDWTPAELQQIRRERVKQGHIDRHTVAFHKAREAGTGEEFLQQWRSAKAKVGLTPDEKRKLGRQFNAELQTDKQIESRNRAIELERTEGERLQKWLNLSARMDAGEATVGEVMQAELDDIAPKGQAVRYQSQLAVKREEAAEKLRFSEALRESMQSGVPLPNTPENREYLEAAYESLGVDPLTPEGAQLTAHMANQTGMVPKSAVNRIGVNLRSGPMGAEAAAAATQLRDTAPAAWQSASIQDQSMASSVETMINAGVPSAEAVRLGRHYAYELTPAERDSVKQTFRTEHQKELAEELEDRVNDLPGAPWIGGAEIDHQMRGAWATLVEQYYAHTNDIERSQDMAWDRLRTVYGVSRVNGQPEVMRFPPEETYPYFEDWGPEQMATQYAESEAPPLPEGATLRLQSDEVTTRTGGQSYTVWVAAPNGIDYRVETTDENGRVHLMRYYPNVPEGNTPEAKRMQFALEKLRKQRERRIKASEQAEELQRVRFGIQNPPVIVPTPPETSPAARFGIPDPSPEVGQ